MSSRRQRSIPLGGRYRQVSLYCRNTYPTSCRSHHSDVIMSAVGSQIAGVSNVYSTVFFKHTSKETSKTGELRLLWHQKCKCFIMVCYTWGINLGNHCDVFRCCILVIAATDGLVLVDPSMHQTLISVMFTGILVKLTSIPVNITEMGLKWASSFLPFSHTWPC